MIDLAISTPPATVLAVVLFLVSGVLCVIQKDWKIGCIAFGLAALSWPW